MKVIQPRPFHPGKVLFVLAVLIAVSVYHFFFRDAPGPSQVHWTGQTMGTHYVVRIADSPLSQRALRELRAEIETYLIEANDQMSTWLPDSEISRFNASISTGPFAVSKDFAAVTRYAIALAEQTDGAFDPTVDPLLALWGFGPDGRPDRVPSDDEIDRALQRIGYQYIRVSDDDRIQKVRPYLTLNLNAIAKGFAADRVGGILNRHGLTNHYVELGGDLVAAGHNHEGNPWRIGVERPDPDAGPGEALLGVAHLSGWAMAGSGDYRDFHESPEGEIYSHILDPRTGRPVRHTLGGVTVVAPTCREADGIATAVFVMGHEEGLRWVNAHPEVEALFMYRREDGTFGTRFSDGFETVTSFERLPQ